MTNKQKLIDLIKAEALEIKPPGEFFILKSGKKSRYYLDLRKITLESYGLKMVIETIWELLLDLKKIFDAIGGPSVGADPIVGGLLYKIADQYCWSEPQSSRGFLIRPQPKDHGKDGRIIGSVRPGDKCLLIEDVTTTGGSLLDAVLVIREFGAVPIMAITVVNRGGEEIEDRFTNWGIPFYSLLNLTDLGITEES